MREDIWCLKFYVDTNRVVKGGLFHGVVKSWSYFHTWLSARDPTEVDKDESGDFTFHSREIIVKQI